MTAASGTGAPPPVRTAIGTLGGLAVIWHKRELISQLVRREVASRYRGSLLGILWSFVIPFVMLAVYTFVFGYIFHARWEQYMDSKAGFAVFLFAGLIVYSLFSECVNRAPDLIVNHANYVKRVVFPLEVLPVVALGSALVHAGLNFVVLLIGHIAVQGQLHWTTVFVPVILFPLLVFILGVTWFLASIGTYIRDVGQLIGVMTMVLLFLGPIYYPATALPQEIRPFLFLNPLTFPIEQLRDVVVVGNTPAWFGLGLYSIVCLTVGASGFLWFQATRKGFADVI